METTTKRKPIRGLLYGIMLGIGLASIAVGQGFAALGTWPPFLLLILGTVAGTAWSTFGPAKGPDGPPPARAEILDGPEPGATEQTGAAGSGDDLAEDGGTGS